MISYAIRNKRTKKYVKGLDFRYNPIRKILSKNEARLYENLEHAEMEFSLPKRYNPKFYEIVKLSIKCVEVIKNDNY